MYEVLNIRLGDERYEELIGQIRTDPGLLAEMWADAEHEVVEVPGKVWTVVLVEQGGRWVPAAWCAATVEQHADGPVLRCGDNYERRGSGRELGLYRVAYRYRHETVVLPSGLPGLTYLFSQPVGPHESDGWYWTGVTGTRREVGLEPHDWWEMRREP